MSDVEDLARIEYVLDNYDDIEKGAADKVYTKYMNSDNTPAAKVIYSKRVNGNYYVVEAVPDSKAKTLRVISAYKEKSEGGLASAEHVRRPAAYVPDAPCVRPFR